MQTSPATPPSLAEVWLNLGIVYASSGGLEAARRAWETVLRHTPNHPEAKAYLARLDAR